MFLIEQPPRYFIHSGGIWLIRLLTSLFKGPSPWTLPSVLLFHGMGIEFSVRAISIISTVVFLFIFDNHQFDLLFILSDLLLEEYCQFNIALKISIYSRWGANIPKF